jgi:hypothetical protein
MGPSLQTPTSCCFDSKLLKVPDIASVGCTMFPKVSDFALHLPSWYHYCSIIAVVGKTFLIRFIAETTTKS